MPWSLTITTFLPVAIGNIVVRSDSSIGRRIVVDGVVKAERFRTKLNAFTFCLLKAA